MKAPRDGDGSEASPVSDGELDTLFSGFQRYPRIALAVSGGADSVALMRLTHIWSARTVEPPSFTVLTVDHGLRAAAAAEAEWVKREAAVLGLDHHTLIWEGAKPATGIQAKARTARYALICDYCRAHDIPALATAHTADDQAETLLMRLARGSGVDGLAGMAPVTPLDGVYVLRPLLALPRSRLVASLNALGQQWVDDPSNEDAHYERVRIRRSLRRAGGELGLTIEALALSARRLRRARDAIEDMTTRFLREALTVHEAGYGETALAALTGAPEEIAVQSLARMARIFGRQTEPLRMAKVEAAQALLRAGGRGATLGGCRFTVRHGALQAVREFGRMERTAITLHPGETVLWDGRFSVTLPHSPHATAPEYALCPLGPEGLAAIAEMGGGMDNIPRLAALALPSLWRGERLCYAPFALWPEGTPLDWLAGCAFKFTAFTERQAV